MASPPPTSPAKPRLATLVAGLVAAACLLLLSGCASLGRPPGRATRLPAPTSIPSRIVSNFFLIEVSQPEERTYRFLIDTGSSTTIVSPAVAETLGVREKRAPQRTVIGAHGTATELEPVTLRRLTIGSAVFEGVPALVFDFTELSGHLGLTIDGVLGFPFFQETLLTLDYPRKRLALAPVPAGDLPLPRATAHASTLTYNAERRTPVIPVQLGVESFNVLIDSGSDSGLCLNPAGLHPRFANGPRQGPLVASIAGDRPQLVGRLAQNFYLGTHTVTQPVSELTDQLSSIGGELLRHFAITFDQQRNLVTFVRPNDEDVRMEPRRSTGLSFDKSKAYWKVLSIVPDSPATQSTVQAGDLCVRINGELVSKWDYERYATLLRTAAKVTYTFLNGARETDVEVPIFNLVP